MPLSLNEVYSEEQCRTSKSLRASDKMVKLVGGTEPNLQAEAASRLPLNIIHALASS